MTTKQSACILQDKQMYCKNLDYVTEIAQLYGNEARQ